ncbi:MAG: TIGR03617 family F420-dependent LLM class oxidoreductase [Chloroflexi bacterium]|nr:TIGR03617 family F420-dependent LLM class oxidoreductase [Chloroflexota bacterium]
MKVFTHISTAASIRPKDVADRAVLAEEMGYDGVTVGETAHDPFLPLTLAAEHTTRITLGTAVAIAFPRSPMIVAQTSWDLQALSNGRFELGLGTQVKGHNERRFSTPWVPPIPRMREYVQALRAIWDTWQNGTKLNYRGQHYNFTLMTPMFNPGPLKHPRPPVLLAAVTPAMGRLAGEVADGVLLHPLCTPKYLREVMWPAFREGAARSGRSLDTFQVNCENFVITGKTAAEMRERKEAVRKQLSFYASTRTYRPVMDTHGWGETAGQLFQMSLGGQTGGGEGVWQQMSSLLTDEMLNEFAVIGTHDEVVGKIKERFKGLITRMALPVPTTNADDRALVQRMVRELQG